MQSRRTTVSADAATPDHTVDGSAVRIGDRDAPVTVTVHEDFPCPACRSFEDTLGATLTELVGEDAATVEYRPVAILDDASTDTYSTRALNTAAVVTDPAGSEAFLAFHELRFARQPAEGGVGLGDDQLIALAEQVEVATRDRAFTDWTRRVTQEASQNGPTGTPSVLVDGQELQTRKVTGADEASNPPTERARPRGVGGCH